MERGTKRKVVAHLLMLAVAMTATGLTMAAQAKEPKGAPVDINKASAEELQDLPGVGPSLAQRIVEFREEHGPFQSVDDLLKVRGIGERSLERIRHLIVAGKSK